MTFRSALSTSARYPIIAAGFRPYWQGISFHGNEVTASQTRITIQPWATYIVFTVGACCPAKPDPPPVLCAHGDRMCVNHCTQAVHTTSSTVIRSMTTPFTIICGVFDMLIRPLWNIVYASTATALFVPTCCRAPFALAVELRSRPASPQSDPTNPSMRLAERRSETNRDCTAFFACLGEPCLSVGSGSTRGCVRRGIQHSHLRTPDHRSPTSMRAVHHQAAKSITCE